MQRTLTSLPATMTIPILNNLSIAITIRANPYQLPINQLFIMAARINKKRSFLFVSKVLGKHIPINPKVGLATSALLAVRYMEKIEHQSYEDTNLLVSIIKENNRDEPFTFPSFQLNRSPVMIGFAETATSLGFGMFHCFKDLSYFHTTREWLKEEDPVITFEEEHSHATSHRCYIPEKYLNHSEEIILVDDEMTSGKTALNIIRSIQEKYPRRIYTVVTILDWRSQADIHAFTKLENELNIKIQIVSLLSGTIKQIGELENTSMVNSKEGEKQPQENIVKVNLHSVNKLINNRVEKRAAVSKDMLGNEMRLSYIKASGRFGITSEEVIDVDSWTKELGRTLKNYRNGSKTLCIGTGEFMYLPLLISNNMGEGVYYQSTTRSPIYVVNKDNYGAQHGCSFPNELDRNIPNYIYNILPYYYDDVFIFVERIVSKESLSPMLQQFENIGLNNIHIVYFSIDEV